MRRSKQMKKFLLNSLPHAVLLSFLVTACQGGYDAGSNYVQSAGEAETPTHNLKLEYEGPNFNYIFSTKGNSGPLNWNPATLKIEQNNNDKLFESQTIAPNNLFAAGSQDVYPTYTVSFKAMDSEEECIGNEIFLNQPDGDLVCTGGTTTPIDSSDPNKEQTAVDSSTSLRTCKDSDTYSSDTVSERGWKYYYLDCAYAKTADACKAKLREKPGCKVEENLIDLGFCLGQTKLNQDYYANPTTADDPHGDNIPAPNEFCDKIGIR